MEITLDNVSKTFASPSRQSEPSAGSVAALCGVTLRVHSGERITVLGPSGSGKTTLLRLVAGLEEPSSGQVMVGDQWPRTRAIAESVAMVFQTLALFPHLIARGNIALGLKIRGVARSEIERRTAEAASLLRIERVLDRQPHQLSAGERQRVALARALVKRPKVLLLDEPLANLDSHLRAELRAELGTLHAQFGMTVICVTHDLLEAVVLGERIAVLHAGRLEQFDTPTQLIQEPASPFVRKFLSFPEISESARRFLAPAETSV